MAKSFCNCCGKIRKDVVPAANNSTSNQTVNDVCFLCRKEASRGKYWNYNENRYDRYATYYFE